MDEEAQLLRETQDYLRDHRNATKSDILDVVEDLSIALLDQWVDEGRIQLYDPVAEMNKVRCMYCGREVSGGGTVCKTCQIKKTLGQKTGGPTAPAKPSTADVKQQRIGGMHFKKK